MGRVSIHPSYFPFCFLISFFMICRISSSSSRLRFSSFAKKEATSYEAFGWCLMVIFLTFALNS